MVRKKNAAVKKTPAKVDTPKTTPTIKTPPVTVKATEPIPTIHKIQWKNNGGTLRLFKNRIIKPGEKFLAYPDEIPMAFRDVIIALEAIPDPTKTSPIEGKVPKYKLVEVDVDQFDIININGKKMNETALSEEVANQLIKDLQG